LHFLKQESDDVDFDLPGTVPAEKIGFSLNFIDNKRSFKPFQCEQGLIQTSKIRDFPDQNNGEKRSSLPGLTFPPAWHPE
jgi:hypothetical protein